MNFEIVLCGLGAICARRSDGAGVRSIAVGVTAPSGSRLKFGYVPFTMNVNIGTTSASYVADVNHPLFAGTSWAGCVPECAPPNHLSDAYSPGMKREASVNPPDASNSACVNRGDGTNAGYAQVDPNIPGSYAALTKGPNSHCVRHAMRPLTPDAAETRRVLDTQLKGDDGARRTLKKQGDDLDLPRLVERYATFRSRPAAEAYATRRMSEGFAVGAIDDAGSSLLVTFRRVDAPARLTPLTRALALEAHAQGGAYDGWSASVARRR